MTPEPVFITGIGAISSIGNSWQEIATSLRDLRHGFAPLDVAPDLQPDVHLYGRIPEFSFEGEPFAWKKPEHYAIPRSHLRSLPPHGVMAYCALLDALQQAGLNPSDLADGETGLYTASAGSPRMLRDQLNASFAVKAKRCHPLGVVNSISGTLSFNLGAQFGIRGEICGFVSACSSSSHALGYAFDAIRGGRQKRILVVAGEDANAESILPFIGMRALSCQRDPRLASRPFDRDRDGFVGTGGGVALVLESGASATERRVRPLCEIAGWGQAADGFNIMVPEPQGDGLARAMRIALLSAQIEAQEIDYINAHATSTRQGDLSEARAILSVFGSGGPPVSSTKALTGHALSMAGALEIAISAIGIAEGILPGNAHLDNLDPECVGLNVPRQSESQSLRSVLCNASGFGGSNVVIALRDVCHDLAQFG